MACDFTSFSSVFQSYQDDGLRIMKGCVQWNPVCDTNQVQYKTIRYSIIQYNTYNTVQMSFISLNHISYITYHTTGLNIYKSSQVKSNLLVKSIQNLHCYQRLYDFSTLLHRYRLCKFLYDYMTFRHCYLGIRLYKFLYDYM